MQHEAIARAKKKKDQVCKKCKAPCCRNLAFAVPSPKNRYDIETLRWYLHFDTVQLYIRNRRWNMLIQGKCIYLSKNNLCTIYERRPKICRVHRSDACEMTGQWYDTLLSSPDDLEAYLKRKKRKRQTARKKAGWHAAASKKRRQ
jgi:Fe-S-cluster containining protein